MILCNVGHERQSAVVGHSPFRDTELCILFGKCLFSSLPFPSLSPSSSAKIVAQVATDNIVSNSPLRKPYT